MNSREVVHRYLRKFCEFCKAVQIGEVPMVEELTSAKSVLSTGFQQNLWKQTAAENEDLAGQFRPILEPIDELQT